MKSSKLLTLLLAAAAALVVLTGSIAVPILCRPFYYAHIGPLRLCEQTGLTQAQIRDAYDQMLDYCLGAEEFSTGVLRYSQSGKDHFTDVRGLFLLDLWVLWGAAVALAVLLIAARLTRRRSARLLGRGPCFGAGAGLGAVFLAVGGLAALDFDRAFVVFHALFFPGKDNWLFDPAADQIITILPQACFRNCAILVLVLLVAACAALIAFDFLSPRRGRRAGAEGA